VSEQNLKTMRTVNATLGIDRWRLVYLIERSTVPETSVKVPGRRLFTPGVIEAIENAFVRFQAQQQ